ncbi:hypothetical protein DPQ22_01695 [Candidatus Tokpelaia sp.]|nr:hypothetical protein DPQ22_01695 [Candidatus Tokpelaia sp.]
MLNPCHNFGDWALLRRELLQKAFRRETPPRALIGKPNLPARARIGRADYASMPGNKGFPL